MSRPLPAPRASRGFTLVEVLVGALVLGIFVSFVYGAVVSAFQVRSWGTALRGGVVVVASVMALRAGCCRVCAAVGGRAWSGRSRAR